MRQEVRPATFEEAEKLRIAPASAVIQIDRLRGMDGTPVCFDVVVIAESRAPELASANLNDAALYETLRTESGIMIHRSAYSLIAATADSVLAPLLGIATGAPVLVGQEIAYGTGGIPILLGLNKYRGDAYRFEADLYRRA
ncbi:UTRA domain-containing protein [Arthrobacter sp. StoSoilB5]|uniref:GntR family transcriptional regulator n=1 Tax=Arthrobacter sp. StoSoilB5 TaxID=2830992 RepID=UPI0021E1681C|nr:UTRA domain-containing protein [Arthrobacter sp. StoSoilB5]